jgi:HAMP domain-containing protein
MNWHTALAVFAIAASALSLVISLWTTRSQNRTRRMLDRIERR